MIIKRALPTLLLFFVIGIVAGGVLTTVDVKSLFHRKSSTVYRTISNGYLSEDVDVLEFLVLCKQVVTDDPRILIKLTSELQSQGFLLKLPTGGRFIILDTRISKFNSSQTFVHLKSTINDTDFWVMSASIQKIQSTTNKKGDQILW